MSDEVKGSLVRKLAEIMGGITRVAKRGRNDFHKYDYVTEADILDALRSELAARKIMVIPRVVRQTRTSVERKTKDGVKTALLVDVDMVFTLMDGESGEVIECPWSGCGEDAGDKALYKAITGADKYFLMKTFMVSTGDDPENDTRKKKTVPTSRPEVHRESIPAVPMISEDQRKELNALVVQLSMSNASASKVIRQAAGVEHSSQIPAYKFTDVKVAMEKYAIEGQMK